MALTKAKLEELIEAGDIVIPGGGGGLSNPMPDTTLIENLNADLLDGNHASAFAPAVHTHPFSNPNLLHNWDFRNPVNQRGVSGTISATGYFYDRWILNSGAVTTNDAYLTVGAGAVIEQRIEGNLLSGATVTVSVMVGGEVYSGAGTMPTSAGTALVTLTGWGTATLGYAEGYMYVRLSPTAASNVQAVKLGLGTVSTLAYDPPMDHAVELQKCQRFYYRIAALSGGRTFGMSMSGSNKGDFNVLINHPVGMRIQPTITHNATVVNALLRAYQGVTHQALDSIVQVPNDEDASSSVKFYRAGYTGFSVGQFFNIVAAHNYVMESSADL